MNKICKLRSFLYNIIQFGWIEFFIIAHNKIIFTIVQGLKKQILM